MEGIKTAWFFGSMVNGKRNKDSDIDLAIVLEDYKYRDSIERELYYPNLDITFMDLNEFNEKVERNDYLLASVIQDSVFFIGDKDLFEKKKRRIFSKKPDEKSIRYNYMQSLYAYDSASISYHNFRYFHRKAHMNTSDLEELKEAVLKDEVMRGPCKMERIKSTNRYLMLVSVNDIDMKIARKYLEDTIKNCEFSAGYFYASKLMKELNRTVTIKDLEGKDNLFNEIHKFVKYYKRTGKADIDTVNSMMYSVWRELNASSIL